MTQLVIIRQEVVIPGVKLDGIIQTNVIKVNIFFLILCNLINKIIFESHLRELAELHFNC